MTDQLPERILIVRSDGAHFVESSPADLNLLGPGADQRKYLSADTAMPKSEADAMVAAAYYSAAMAACDWVNGDVAEPDKGIWAHVANRTPVDARTAFEKAVQEAVDPFKEEIANCKQWIDELEVEKKIAVQEAVEAERERCAQVALRHFGYEPSDEEMHTVMDIAAAIRAQGTSE